MNILKNKDTAIKVTKIKQNFEQFYKKYIKNNSLMFTILFSIMMVYILFTVFNTFFKIPVILFLGTILGLYIHKNKK
tara:strand:+ start:1436 stop:1666 length:231 start_codon:yes stop_codon:yes gene_type:complete